MREDTKTTYHERMHAALLFIQEHLDGELPVERVAGLTHVSVVQFHRIFKGMVGETFGEHVRRLRLERAALRLAHAGASVTDAAFNAGYETVESFSRAFKARFSVPPSQYGADLWRRMHERIPGLIPFLPEEERSALPLLPKETTMDVTIETLEPQTVAFVRHIGPYAECRAAWDTLCGWACQHGLFGPDTRFLGIGHDDPHITPPEKIRYDACITVPPGTEVGGEVGMQTIPGGDYAVVLHQGPYDNMERTYAELMGAWLPQSGREMRPHPGFEQYLNTPDKTPPEELRTLIRIPLK